MSWPHSTSVPISVIEVADFPSPPLHDTDSLRLWIVITEKGQGDLKHWFWAGICTHTTQRYIQPWDTLGNGITTILLLPPSTSLPHETGSFRGMSLIRLSHTLQVTPGQFYPEGRASTLLRPTSWFWLFRLFISYHNKSDISWDSEDIVWPGINRAPKIAEQEDDPSVSEVGEPVHGSHVTTVF